NQLVHIADTSDQFIELAEKELAQKDKKKWLQKVDKFISEDSWDNTVSRIRTLLYEAISNRQLVLKKKPEATISHHYLLKGSLPAAS
ncbi:MAG: hypothetical protein H0X41_10950, partial [Chitinophagaceae bacterium]|nr:hypothetical protein [Chitinophagaceae bacterium]